MSHNTTGYKEFCMEYSPLWDRNMEHTQKWKEKGLNNLKHVVGEER